MNERKKCVFAGTFDPPTLGHESVIRQSLDIFDEVVVAVMVNPQKQPAFTVAERMEMLRLVTGNNPRVRIVEFSGTVAELLKAENTKFYVRGIRNGTDLDYENANFYATKKLDNEVVAIYLPCEQEYLHISSSMVRSSLQFQTPIDEYVSEKIKEYIRKSK
jgi:pantetheine-phosphate adenylyltransferase